MVLSVPLFGNFSALYMFYSFVQIGTPPVSFSVVVDTGSSDFFVPQVGCKSCIPPPKGSVFYNASKSSSSVSVRCGTPGSLRCDNSGVRCAVKDAPCETSVDYGGSMIEQANLFSDSVQMNTNFYPSDPVAVSTFGAIFNISQTRGLSAARHERTVAFSRSHAMANGFFYPEGMLGLALRPLTGADYPPLMDIILPAAGLPDVFSMCLTPEHGGMMTLGGVDPTFLGSGGPEVQYTPIALPPNGGPADFYRVQIEALVVGGLPLTGISPHVLNENSIVDSGTPFPTLPTIAYEALKTHLLSTCATTPLKGLCSEPSNATLFEQVCFSMSPSERGAYPTLSFGLKGNVSLDYPSPWLLKRGLYFCEDKSKYGLALSAEEHFTVIGAPLLQRYLTIYDRVKMRVGFASTEGHPCQTPPLP